MTSAAFVLAALVVWSGSGIWLAITDLRTGRLPTPVIWRTVGVVWTLYAVASLNEGEPGGLIGAATGAVLCGALLFAVHITHPPSMGFGDVRLSVLNGLLCGWWGWHAALLGLLAGFFLALPEALVVLARQGIRASRPFGPYMVAGTAVVAIWMWVAHGLTSSL